MRATIQDKETLCSVQLPDIIGYIKNLGAKKVGSYRDVANIWALKDIEILIPASRKLADYAARIADILRLLEQYEQRSQLEILKNISLNGYDVIRVRSISEEIESGSLPLDAAVELTSSTRDMMLSAACSAATSRSSYPSKKPKEAEEYLQRIRMGQTERGSFILTVLSPVPPALQQCSLGPDLQSKAEDPFERRVVTTLNSGLTNLDNSVKQALESNSDELFWKQGNGISTNLCDAIIRMHETVHAESTIVSISWSRNRPTAPTAPIQFNTEYIPAIKEAVRLYKLREPEADQHICGYIVKCHQEPAADCGELTILDILAGSNRRILLRLCGDEYKSAVEYHGSGKIVQTYGDIKRTGRNYQLLNHAPLRPVESENDIE